MTDKQERPSLSGGADGPGKESGRPGIGVVEINPVHGSIGAYRVRESFNPSRNNMVDKIKRYTADLIDLCEEIKSDAHAYSNLAETLRCCALAQTAYEDAAMWAVKAATAPKP